MCNLMHIGGPDKTLKHTCTIIVSIVLLEGHAIPTDVGIAFWVIFEGLNQKLINTNICVSKFRVIIDATLIDACAKTVMCAYGLQLLLQS